ncbi:ionotropic receptor 75a [Nilaparvata lugens]|uniref:ionotropic receptor 75a n=1 Tax=Nilaparvata lugens TaxID=108931 RepID=UPI00193D4B16|nr:ionotropic receptor 75a [Nilaparvata lugens]XP_039288431.1 ionotropic receptor 75a [Nilaparvata lugens]
MRSPYNKMGAYVDYSCEFGKNVLHQASNDNLLNTSYIWYVRSNTSEILSDWESYNFGLDSDIVLAEEIVNNGVVFYDIYKVNTTLSLVAVEAGTWTTNYGLGYTIKGPYIQRRNDFGGIKFKGTLVITDLNNLTFNEQGFKKFLDNSYESQFDSASRCSYSIYSYLADMFNFTLEAGKTFSWGYPVNVGKPVLHDGMIGQLEGKEIDIGLTPAAMLIRTRMDVVHFAIVPIWQFRVLFVFRHPSTLASYKALIIPFEPAAWMFTILLTICVGAFLTMIKRLSQPNDREIDKSFSGNIVITIGALFNQGLANCSTRIPERTLNFLTLIIGILIYSFYNSMIVTSLLQPPAKTIRTPRALMESHIKCAMQNHSYVRFTFEKNKDPLFVEMYKRKILKGPGPLLSAMDGMKMVQQAHFAFYGEEPIIYRLIENEFTNEEICSLSEIDMDIPLPLYLPVKRNSPLREYLNFALLRMRETGILDEQSRKWHPRKPECQGNANIPAVQLQSVLVAYIVYFAGVVLSLILLLLETLTHARKPFKKFNKKLNRVKFMPTAKTTWIKNNW